MDKYEKWSAEGYMIFRTIPGQGICAIMKFAFSVDLCCNMSDIGYKGRYSFATLGEALNALITWTGEGRPEGWITHHGGAEGKTYNTDSSSYVPNDYS